MTKGDEVGGSVGTQREGKVRGNGGKLGQRCGEHEN